MKLKLFSYNLLLFLVEGTIPVSIEDKDLTVQIKQTRGSWWRIIKLGKEEWKLYIIGFICLLIAALGRFKINKNLIQFSFSFCFLAEMFQPFFSGHIISSVVNKDWHNFFFNIFWFLGILVF